MAAMAAHEDNITEKHEGNIIIYIILIVLIKEIKLKIDKIINDDLKKYILDQTDKEDFDKYKKMFNQFVERLPAIRKIKNKYILDDDNDLDDDDDNEINFKLLDKTIKRTIAQIEQIILAFMVICRKNKLDKFSKDLSEIIDDFIKQVKSIRTPEGGKIKKKRNQKKEKQKTKKENKKKQKKKSKKRNQTKREIKPNKKINKTKQKDK